MFEKDAEEYANEYGQDAFTQVNMPQWIKPIRTERKLGFQKGAEFGYNKANEWHYPSKGEYPKENKRYLCKIEMFVGDGITYECFDYDTEYNSWKDVCGEVIAWKEIVPPKGITYSTPLKEQGDWVVRDKEPS